MPLYRRTESGSAKKSVLFSMCKQSLQEGKKTSQICKGMRDKTSTWGKFCSLSSKICRLEILRGNRRGKKLTILLRCCSLFFTKTIISISQNFSGIWKSLQNSPRETLPFFQGYMSGSTLQVVTCWRKNTVLINHIFHVIWKLPTQKTFQFTLFFALHNKNAHQ